MIKMIIISMFGMHASKVWVKNVMLRPKLATR